MSRLHYTFLLCFFALLLGFGQHNNYEQKAEALLQKMTLEEKLGQLNLPSAGDITTGQAQSSDIASKIRSGKVGGLFNIKSVEKIREIQKIAVEESRLGIPLLFAMDVIHGYETTFPIPLGLSSSWDMNLIQQSAAMAAKEATADGICWTFSPMVDISRDPRWGRIAEGAGEDPYLGSEIAKAMVRGYQGENLENDNTMLACIKHFALYGAPEGGRDYNTVDMSRIKMYNEYFPPYQAGVQAGAETVMASFNEVDGIPATGNKWLMTAVLRNQWGFDGFVVSDYTGINEMIEHGMGDLQNCSALAMNAGIDMDMVGEGFLTTLPQSLKEGKVNIEQIDHAVKQILISKFKLGLFDDPFKYCNLQRSQSEVFTPENRKFARKVASESMVLMKNDQQILPLEKNKKIALIGPLGNSPLNMAGTWSVATPQDQSVTLLQGLKNALGENTEIIQTEGCKLDYDAQLEANYSMFGKVVDYQGKSSQQLRQEAFAAAAQSDIIIAAMGESAEMSGESSSRVNLEIPQSQKDLLNALRKTGKPIILVLFTGRPLIISDEMKNMDAILNVWFPGTEAGNAICDVLFGDVNPSGKLTMTFPRSVGQIPIYHSMKRTGRPLDENNTDQCQFSKFRSNYLDECNTPLFPFGYGLSYTSFKYGEMTLSSNSLTSQRTLKASVQLTNTGNYDGAEVVQLYIRDKVGSVTRPVKELKGFQKVFLKKGESKTVTFEITEKDLRFYNSALEWESEPGEFEVFIGKDASVKESKMFTLTL